MNIPWITIHVQDFEKSKSFYSDYLGMKLEQEFPAGKDTTIAFYEAENKMKVELIYNKNTASEKKDNRGISIGVFTADYEKLLQQARTENILTAEPAVLGGNMECFFVSDPDGVGIQIIKGE